MTHFQRIALAIFILVSGCGDDGKKADDGLTDPEDLREGQEGIESPPEADPDPEVAPDPEVPDVPDMEAEPPEPCTCSGVDPATVITVDPASVTGTSSLRIGLQMSFQGGDLLERDDVRDLYAQIRPRIVRIFDWRDEDPSWSHTAYLDPCVSWDEASRTGTFDWTQVDRIVGMIFDMGAEPLVTIGASGSSYPPDASDERYLPEGMTLDPATLLPDPEQFAAYAAEWVRHFRDADPPVPVRFYEIWNEAYGYFDWNGADTDNLARWVDLWVEVAGSMHAENPDILIGNDHVTAHRVLDAFIERDADLGFLSYHKYDSGDLAATDAELFGTAETRYIDPSGSQYGVTEARGLWREATGLSVPVIDSESNMNWEWDPSTDPRLQQMAGAVWNALVLRREILEGVDYHVWFDEYSRIGTDGEPRGFGMIGWTEPAVPWLSYYLYRWIGNTLEAGDPLVESAAGSEALRTLAWMHEGSLAILVIHKEPAETSICIEGPAGPLSYRRIDDPDGSSYLDPQEETGTAAFCEPVALAGYTVMLIR